MNKKTKHLANAPFDRTPVRHDMEKTRQTMTVIVFLAGASAFVCGFGIAYFAFRLLGWW